MDIKSGGGTAMVDAISPQRGTKASVDRIRYYLDIWERGGSNLGRINAFLKFFSLLAAAIITAFGSSIGHLVLASLGLVAFSGTAIAGAFSLAKKSDMYWRAWRIVNYALISYDAHEIDFSQLAQAHRIAEHIFEAWDTELPGPPTAPLRHE
jgi:hypothetical protein